MTFQPTIKDVAQHAGVGIATVSRVFNQSPSVSKATRQKVLLAAQELGYFPDAAAQALASGRTKTIGLVMTRSPHHISTDTFLPQIIGGLLEVVNQYKLRLLIESVAVEHQELAYLKLVRANHIDGMILLTPRIDDLGLKKLEETDAPIVLMGNLEHSNLYSVDVDNRQAAKTAAKYLLDLGHSQIACIANAPASYSAAKERVLGYQDAFLEAGLIPNDGLIRYADFDPQSGFDCMQSLLQSKKNFTAVFVASDNVAVGAESALRAAGMDIPKDMSIIGFDDVPWVKYSNPPLTTIHLPAQELARTACLMLMEILQGSKPKKRKQTLTTKLIVRQSCLKL